MAFLEKQLRRLESEDWVVVFEEDLSGLPEPTDEETNAEAKTTRPRKKEEFYPTLITQEDYILIWNQFQVTDVFLALIQSFVSDVSNQSMSSQKEYSDILRLFSIAHHTSLIFLRGLHILPKDYTRLRESIASTLILITKTLCQQISQAFNSYPILTLQHQDHITTLQTELDAFVMRQVQHLTKIQGDEVWLHLCSLPFDYLSLSTKIDVGRLLCDLVANCLSESRKISYSCLCSLMDAIVAHFLSKNLTSSPASSNLSSSWAGTNLNMLRKLYDCCFLHPETPISVHIRARDSIIQVTLAFPHWLSSLLPWIRDDFSKLDWNMLVLLLLQMPVEAYEIKSQELSLLLDILKDQDSPLKSRFGMMFLERLNWDYKTNSFQELFLPRQLHRSVAIEMVNLYLDKCHSKDQASLLASVSQKATSTLEKLGITQGDDYKFEVWIW